MNYYFLLFFVCLSTFAIAHDAPIAHFNLVEKEAELLLDMEFDQGALESAILGSTPTKSASLSNNQIKNYIGEHLNLVLNGRKAKIRIVRVSRKGHHVYVQATVKKQLDIIIEEVVFENTCLIEVVPDHNNVLLTDINCVTRGFRLTKDRQRVAFSY